MSIDVRREDDLDRWDDLVERSPGGTPFHLSGFLRVLRDRSSAELHPLVGYKGEEPVGLLPLFEIERGPLTALVSPPPRLKVSYHGPLLLNFGKLKCRRAEKRHRRFVEACLEFVDAEVSPNYVNVRTGPHYDDVRAFLWNGFEASPGYTYVVDISPGEEALLEAFSTDARRNVKDGPPDGCEIQVGGPDEIERIVEQVVARHEEQGEDYPVTPDYLVDLWRELPEGTVRPYTCTVDGSFAGGMITLEQGDTIYSWQGGVKAGTDFPINDLLDWHIIRDAIDRGFSRYDLVGANNPRISPFKAKFAPELEEYYDLARASPLVRFAVDVYSRFR